jgi:dethiobiotin synthetase
MAHKAPLFITGIGTDVGKTIASAVMVEHYQADYWKPIQSGDLHNSDTMKVQAMVSNPVSKFHAETYRLNQPFSPHKSAQLDGVTIDLENFILPQTSNQLIIEGAGGLMVPLNGQQYVVDLISKLNVEVMLVVKHYLGSINHTVLSLELLKQRNIKLHSIIYNGPADTYSEAIIDKYCNRIIHIPHLESLSKESIKQQAQGLQIQKEQ